MAYTARDKWVTGRLPITRYLWVCLLLVGGGTSRSQEPRTTRLPLLIELFSSEQRLRGRQEESAEQLCCRGESGRSRIELIAAHESVPELELCRVSDEVVGKRERRNYRERRTTTAERAWIAVARIAPVKVRSWANVHRS